MREIIKLAWLFCSFEFLDILGICVCFENDIKFLSLCVQITYAILIFLEKIKCIFVCHFWPIWPNLDPSPLGFLSFSLLPPSQLSTLPFSPSRFSPFLSPNLSLFPHPRRPTSPAVAPLLRRRTASSYRREHDPASLSYAQPLSSLHASPPHTTPASLA